jgi:hypothetical protein
VLDRRLDRVRGDRRERANDRRRSASYDRPGAAPPAGERGRTTPPLAPSLTSRAVLEKMAAVQMLDVHFPTTDGRTLILSRYTELNADQKLLLKQLKLDLPPRPPPRITSAQRSARPQVPAL